MTVSEGRKLSRSRLKKVNLSEKFGKFRDYWSPKIVGELNDSCVKLVKLKGEFVWHRHAKEHELFLVAKGRLTLKLRRRNVDLRGGEFFVVPRGVEHKPVAQKEAHVVLMEQKTTRNTGRLRNESTIENLERI